MWYLRKPTVESLERFRAEQTDQPFTYAAVGASDAAPPPGFVVDDNSVCLERGQAVFAAAGEALRRWRQFPSAWVQIHPSDVEPRVGLVVVVLARAFGIWWRNAARVVYVVQEPRRQGFAYGTLPGHIECGEERFQVEWRADDTVWYGVRAFSRPNYWLVRLGYPIARRMQRRFARDSMAGMLDAVRASGVVAREVELTNRTPP